MEREYNLEMEKNLSNLEQAVRQLPNCEVYPVANNSLVVKSKNGATIILFPLSSTACDITARDASQRDWSFNGVSWQDALDLLAVISTAEKKVKEETSTSGAVQGYNSAKAFSHPLQRKNNATAQSERENWTVIGEEKSERDQSGRKSGSRLENPFGEDPLGRKAMADNPDKKKNSEGRRKTETGHNFEKNSPLALTEDETDKEIENLESNLPAYLVTFEYLKEMLPMQADDICIDENGMLVLYFDDAKVEVTATEETFKVQTFIGGELNTSTEKIGGETLYKFLFSLAEKLNATKAEFGQEDLGQDDVSVNEAWSVIHELAKENGESDDLLRNKNLFDLKGLCVGKNSFDDYRFWT